MDIKHVPRGIIGVLLLLVALPRTALADGASVAAEPVRLAVDAPAACLVAQRDLVEEVERIGGHVRPAGEGEPARRFDVTIVLADGRLTTRLVVRDLRGRETARSVENDSCADAKGSASLLVSLALDEAPEPDAPPPTSRWPRPAERDVVRPVSSSTIESPGTGGLVVSGFYGGRNGRPDAEIDGVRAYAAWKVGATRVGAAVSVQRDGGVIMDSNSHADGSAMSGRLGAVVGWGAPWTDAIAGFVGEAGVTAGEAKDTRKARSYVGSYVGGWLVVQLPWSYAIRPVVSVGTVYSPNGPDNLPVAITGEAGVVWKAW